LAISKEGTLDHLTDIAGQSIKKGDIIAYVRTRSRGPELKVGKVLSVSSSAGNLIVWEIDDEIPRLSRPGPCPTVSTLQSTNRIVVLDPYKIRSDYMELLASVTLGEGSPRPIPKKEPVGRCLSLVPPPAHRRRT
jgi:hypothetical protein